MKPILSLILLLICLSVKAQDWKKQCLLQNGDTLKVGDSIHILSQSSEDLLKVIKPHFHYSEEVWFIYRNHISFMRGGTYPITRMSRIAMSGKRKQYIPLAIVESKHASTVENVEYTIRIDSALNMGLIEIIR